MSCAFLAAGAWALDAAEGPVSVASSIMGNAAVTLWLCVPTCVVFAWQGYRKMATAKPPAIEYSAPVLDEHPDVVGTQA